MNDGKDDGGNPQVMKCLLGYINFLHAPSPNTKERKALTTYYKTYEITALKKDVDRNHVLIVKIFEKEVNGPIKKTFEMQLAKKRPNVSSNAISKLFVIKNPLKNDDGPKKQLQNLGLLIVKNEFVICGKSLV